jgi:hypothetical protein
MLESGIALWRQGDARRKNTRVGTYWLELVHPRDVLWNLTAYTKGNAVQQLVGKRYTKLDDSEVGIDTP